jgi:anti-sigma factor RsiW
MRHLTSEQIQEFLDQRLSPGEEAQVREHLSACPACQEEVEGWSLLFSDLGNLGDLEPGPTFAGRVLQEVPAGEVVPGLMGEWMRARRKRRIEEAHIPAGSFQDYLEKLIPPQPAARLEAHLRVCPTCFDELERWEALMASCRTLERFGPSPGFAQRVMAQVRVPTPEPLGRRQTIPGRAVAWVREFLPQTRRGWAVAGGMASTPTITLGALVFLVFSHPLLTVGTFASYLYWKASDLLAGLWSVVADAALQSVALSYISSVLEVLAQSPVLLGLGGLVFSILGMGALWILYRNLLVSPSDDQYARVRV